MQTRREALLVVVALVVVGAALVVVGVAPVVVVVALLQEVHGGVKGRSRRMNVAILFLLRHLVGEKTCEVFSCHLHVCNREYD